MRRDQRDEDGGVSGAPQTDGLERGEGRTLDRAAAPLAGASGALAGGVVGTLILGPIGTAIGAVGGALGGWWAGAALSESIPYTTEDDSHYRAHFGATHRVGRTWEDVSPAYHLGHLSARNPAYHGRPFEDIESDLRRIWNTDLRVRHGEWSDVRQYAREAYGRAMSEAEVARNVVGADLAADLRGPIGMKPADLDMGGTQTHHRAEFSDPGPSDAHPEAGFFDRPIGATEPSHGDDAADRADGMGPMIDRGGFREHDPKPSEDRGRRGT